MRIIAGLYRGKKLISPDSQSVRPTADRTREAVFNILYSKLAGEFQDCSLLDVFSGSGAFSLEAISRGIKQATMIDIDTRPLLKNVALFPNEKSKINVLNLNACHLPPAPRKYDLVFMDAPYNQGLSEQALFQLAQQEWLQKGALCLVETERSELIDIPASYTLIDERIYGLAKVLFLKFTD